MPVVKVAVSPQKAGIGIANTENGSGHAAVGFVDGNGVPVGNPGFEIVEEPNQGCYIQLVGNPGPGWMLGAEGDGRIRVNR